jgi:hypothetical protein
MGKEQDLTPDEPDKPNEPDNPEGIFISSKAIVKAEAEVKIEFTDSDVPYHYEITLFTNDTYTALLGLSLYYLEDSYPKIEEEGEEVINTYNTKTTEQQHIDAPDEYIYFSHTYNHTETTLTKLELDNIEMGDEAGNYTLNFKSTDTTGDITTTKYTIKNTTEFWSNIAFIQEFSYTTTEPEA